MINIIDASDPKTFPKEIIDLFSAHKSELEGYKSVCDIPFSEVFGNSFYQTNKEYKDYCVTAYHYTREIKPGYFKNNGLRVFDFEKHKEFVIDVLQNLLPIKLLERIENLPTPDGREGDDSIWFCYQRDDSDAGIIPLVRYFGGECISGQLNEVDNKQLLSILEQIGNPMVVKFCYRACDVEGGTLMMVMLSSYLQKFCDSDFRVFKGEDNIKKDITPEQIIEVCPVKIPTCICQQ